MQKKWCNIVRGDQSSTFANHLNKNTMRYLKKSMFALVLLIQANSSQNAVANKEMIDGEPFNSVYAKEYIWNKYYQETLDFIKEHEGFKPTPYYCSAGILTIGYGHAIKENEQFNSPITEKQAEDLLVKDFNIALNAVDRTITVSGSRKIALAHFVFSVGIGNFNRSTLKKYVIANKPIDEAILMWSNYTNTQGDKIKSQVAYGLREWELDMYNRDEDVKLMAVK
jgi:lysozyme